MCIRDRASETPAIKPHDAPARQLYVAAAGETGHGAGTHIEDDGTSWAFRHGDMLECRFEAEWSAKELVLRIQRSAGQRPLPDSSAWRLSSPALAGRRVRIVNAGDAAR